MSRIELYTMTKWNIEVPVNVEGGVYWTPVEPGDFRLQLKDDKIPMCCVFLCPCGCGHHINLGLQGGNDVHPYLWTIASIDDKHPTISPSVNMFGIACKSHFFIRDGKVQWA